MAETTQLVLTEENRVFKKINYCFALFFAGIVFVQFIIGIFAYETLMSYLIDIWAILYATFFFACLPANIKFWKQLYKKSKLFITLWSLAIALFALLIISAAVNTTFNLNVTDMFCYALIFVCFFNLEKKNLKVVINVLVASIAFSALLGLIDPYGTFMPGFTREAERLATFFIHPNYSGTVVAVGTILVVNLLLREKNKYFIVLYSVYYCVMSLFLYLNSALASVTAVYVVLIVEFIVVFIKTKKFPWKILLFFLSFAAFAGIIELYPNISKIRNAGANYFVEILAAFDKIFGTHLLKDIAGIDGEIPGADGWSRKKYIINALIAVTGGNGVGFFEGVKNFLFGLGGGKVHEYRPHNLFVGLWLDFGLLFTLTLIAIVVIMVVIRFKYCSNREDSSVMLYAMLCYGVVTLLGSLISVHFIYFVMLAAIMMCYSKDKLFEKKEEK